MMGLVTVYGTGCRNASLPFKEKTGDGGFCGSPTKSSIFSPIVFDQYCASLEGALNPRHFLRRSPAKPMTIKVVEGLLQKCCMRKAANPINI